MVTVSRYLWIPNLKIEHIDFNYVLDGLYRIEDHPKPHTLSLYLSALCENMAFVMLEQH